MHNSSGSSTSAGSTRYDAEALAPPSPTRSPRRRDQTPSKANKPAQRCSASPQQHLATPVRPQQDKHPSPIRRQKEPSDKRKTVRRASSSNPPSPRAFASRSLRSSSPASHTELHESGDGDGDGDGEEDNAETETTASGVTKNTPAGLATTASTPSTVVTVSVAGAGGATAPAATSKPSSSTASSPANLITVPRSPSALTSAQTAIPDQSPSPLPVTHHRKLGSGGGGGESAGGAANESAVTPADSGSGDAASDGYSGSNSGTGSPMVGTKVFRVSGLGKGGGGASTSTATITTAVLPTAGGAYKSVPVLPPQVFRTASSHSGNATALLSPAGSAAIPLCGGSGATPSIGAASAAANAGSAISTPVLSPPQPAWLATSASAAAAATSRVTTPLSSINGPITGSLSVQSPTHFANRLAYSIGGSRRRNSVSVPTNNNTAYVDDDDNVNSFADEACLSNERWSMLSQRLNTTGGGGSSNHHNTNNNATAMDTVVTSRSSSRDPASLNVTTSTNNATTSTGDAQTTATATAAGATTAETSGSPTYQPTNAWKFVRPQPLTSPRSPLTAMSNHASTAGGNNLSLLSPKSPLSVMSGQSGTATTALSFSAAAAANVTITSPDASAQHPLMSGATSVAGATPSGGLGQQSLYSNVPVPPPVPPHQHTTNMASYNTNGVSSYRSRDNSLAVSLRSPLHSPPSANVAPSGVLSGGRGGNVLSRRDSLGSLRLGAHDPYNAIVITPNSAPVANIQRTGSVTSLRSPSTTLVSPTAPAGGFMNASGTAPAVISATAASATAPAPTAASPIASERTTATAVGASSNAAAIIGQSPLYYAGASSDAMSMHSVSVDASRGAQDVMAPATGHTVSGEQFLYSSQHAFFGNSSTTMPYPSQLTDPQLQQHQQQHMQQPQQYQACPQQMPPLMSVPLAHNPHGSMSFSQTQLPPQQQQQMQMQQQPQQHMMMNPGGRPPMRRRTAQEALTGFFSEAPIELGDQTHLSVDRHGVPHNEAQGMSAGDRSESGGGRSGSAMYARSPNPSSGYTPAPAAATGGAMMVPGCVPATMMVGQPTHSMPPLPTMASMVPQPQQQQYGGSSSTIYYDVNTHPLPPTVQQQQQYGMPQGSASMPTFNSEEDVMRLQGSHPDPYSQQQQHQQQQQMRFPPMAPSPPSSSAQQRELCGRVSDGAMPPLSSDSNFYRGGSAYGSSSGGMAQYYHMDSTMNAVMPPHADPAMGYGYGREGDEGGLMMDPGMRQQHQQQQQQRVGSGGNYECSQPWPQPYQVNSGPDVMVQQQPSQPYGGSSSDDRSVSCSNSGPSFVAPLPRSAVTTATHASAGYRQAAPPAQQQQLYESGPMPPIAPSAQQHQHRGSGYITGLPAPGEVYYNTSGDAVDPASQFPQMYVTQQPQQQQQPYPQQGPQLYSGIDEVDLSGARRPSSFNVPGMIMKRSVGVGGPTDSTLSSYQYVPGSLGPSSQTWDAPPSPSQHQQQQQQQYRGVGGDYGGQAMLPQMYGPDGAHIGGMSGHQ